MYIVCTGHEKSLDGWLANGGWPGNPCRSGLFLLLQNKNNNDQQRVFFFFFYKPNCNINTDVKKNCTRIKLTKPLAITDKERKRKYVYSRQNNTIQASVSPSNFNFLAPAYPCFVFNWLCVSCYVALVFFLLHAFFVCVIPFVVYPMHTMNINFKPLTYMQSSGEGYVRDITAFSGFRQTK